MTIKLRVRGELACFTRPEMKAERVSYDVITPSAARGILDAIHFSRGAMRWVIDRLHILAPIQFTAIRRNEVGSKISERVAKMAMNRSSLEGLHLLVDEDRQQRATLALRDVDYVIEAHVELLPSARPGETLEKHTAMFIRRAAKGQAFHQPCLGMREFPAIFELVDGAVPPTRLPEEERNRDLGWMLYDIDFKEGMTPRFFRARMENSVIDLTRLDPGETAT